MAVRAGRGYCQHERLRVRAAKSCTATATARGTAAVRSCAEPLWTAQPSPYIRRTPPVQWDSDGRLPVVARPRASRRNLPFRRQCEAARCTSRLPACLRLRHPPASRASGIAGRDAQPHNNGRSDQLHTTTRHHTRLRGAAAPCVHDQLDTASPHSSAVRVVPARRAAPLGDAVQAVRFDNLSLGSSWGPRSSPGAYDSGCDRSSSNPSTPNRGELPPIPPTLDAARIVKLIRALHSNTRADSCRVGGHSSQQRPESTQHSAARGCQLLWSSFRPPPARQPLCACAPRVSCQAASRPPLRRHQLSTAPSR